MDEEGCCDQQVSMKWGRQVFGPFVGVGCGGRKRAMPLSRRRTTTTNSRERHVRQLPLASPVPYGLFRCQVSERHYRDWLIRAWQARPGDWSSALRCRSHSNL